MFGCQCRSHTPSCASPCFQCEMSRTTSENVKRNTDSWDIKRRYTFLTSCHVHRESRSILDKGGKYCGATFPFSFPSPSRGHTDSAQVDLLFCRLSKNYAVSSTCASWVQLCIFPIKKGVEILTFFKMSILASPDVSSNAHLLFLDIYRLSLRGCRIPF